MELYDNSRLSNFKRCPRYYYYRDVRHWTPDVKSAALVFGGAWHSAMDTLWRLCSDDPQNLGAASEYQDIVDDSMAAFEAHWIDEGMTPSFEMDPEEIKRLGARTPMTAREMLYEYIEARAFIFTADTFELLDIERPFAVALDANNPDLLYVGRLDKVFRLNGKIYVGEHKTTTAYRKDGGFMNSFLESFSPNSQVDGYLHALHMLYGADAKAIWIDAALVHRTVHDAFKIIPIERQVAHIDSWLADTHYWIDRVQEENDQNRSAGTAFMGIYPKNTGSCTMYAGCTYQSLCKAYANPEKQTECPGGFKVEAWSPVKVLELEKIGVTEDA